MNQESLLVILGLAVVIAIISIVGCEHRPIGRSQSQPAAERTVQPRREAPDGAPVVFDLAD